MNKTSLAKLATARAELQTLAHNVDARYSIQCICGERNEVDQQKAFRSGMSRVQYPHSKHNVGELAGRELSDAIDCIPDPDKNPATIDWKDIKEFNKMCDIFLEEAAKLKIKIRLGRDFKFKDMPHVEFVGHVI